MFFAKIARSFSSIAVRLTVAYAGIFSLSFFLVFVAIYLVVWTSVSQRTDEDLREEHQELLVVAEPGDDKALAAGILLEAELEGVENLFVRLVADDGSVLATSNMLYWQDVEDPRLSVNGPNGLLPFQTIKLPGRSFPLRVFSTEFGEGRTLQIGKSLEHDGLLLRTLRRVTLLAMIVVVSGAGLFVWFMTRHALAGVEQVRKAALDISQGSLQRRVPLKGNDDEIDRLAQTFNVMVERIAQLIGGMKEFSDNLAHDLRSPVARIRGAAESALMFGGSAEEYRASLATTVEECDRLLALTNAMLELSELEAGISTLNREAIRMDELVQDIGDLFHPAAEAQGITLKLEVADGGKVFADRQSLQRALANLIDNAIKFTPMNGWIKLSSNTEENHVCVTVADSGRGIARSQLPHVFDRFYRSDRSRSDRGNGLGLSLSRALIEAHDGKISVVSALNQGSVFTLILPLHREEEST